MLLTTKSSLQPLRYLWKMLFSVICYHRSAVQTEITPPRLEFRVTPSNQAVAMAETWWVGYQILPYLSPSKKKFTTSLPPHFSYLGRKISLEVLRYLLKKIRNAMVKNAQVKNTTKWIRNFCLNHTTPMPITAPIGKKLHSSEEGRLGKQQYSTNFWVTVWKSHPDPFS